MIPSPGVRAATSMRRASPRSSIRHSAWVMPFSTPSRSSIAPLARCTASHASSRGAGTVWAISTKYWESTSVVSLRVTEAKSGLAVLDQALHRVLLTGDLLLHQDGLLRRIVVQLRGQLGAVVHRLDTQARVPRGRLDHRGEPDGPVVHGPTRPGWDQHGCRAEIGQVPALEVFAPAGARRSQPREREVEVVGDQAGRLDQRLPHGVDAFHVVLLPPASGVLDDAGKEGALALDRPVDEGDLVDRGGGVSGIVDDAPPHTAARRPR